MEAVSGNSLNWKPGESPDKIRDFFPPGDVFFCFCFFSSPETLIRRGTRAGPGMVLISNKGFHFWK